MSSRKSRRRARSVSDLPYKLVHSVSIEEKKTIVRKISRKELEEEIIRLDAAKNILERKINDLEHGLDKAETENSILNDHLKKQELEKIKLERDLENERTQREVETKQRQISDIELEKGRHILECEINDLKHNLEKNDLEKTGLSKDLEKMKLENSKLEKSLENERETHMKQTQDFDEQKDKMEEENRQKFGELIKERNEKWKYVHHFSNLLQNSRAKVFISGHSKNIQIGETNIIENEVMSQLQELIDKLLTSVDDYMAKRQELEMKVHNYEIMMKEMKDSINKSLEKTPNKKLDRERLAFLAADRSDECIFTEGIKQLEEHLAVSKRMKTLPLPVEAMVERLLNKLEGITCGDFITILEGKKSTPNMEMTSDDTEQTEVKQLVTEVDPLHEFDNDIPLEKFHCVGILSKWIQKSKENDFESFIGKMKAYESKQATESIKQYEEEIKNKDVSRHVKDTNPEAKGSDQLEGSSAQSSSPPAEQSHSGLPDALSQFMHQLECMTMVADIDRKVDMLLKASTDSICPIHNARHEITHPTSGVK